MKHRKILAGVIPSAAPSTRGRLGILAAGVITVVTMLAPASAIAAPTAGSASPAPTDSSVRTS